MSSNHIEFLFDENITAKLNELIPRAMYHIVICNPWLDPENYIIEKLISSLKNKIKIEIITLQPEKDKYKIAIDKLIENGAKVYLKDNLHAKIFYFDHRDLIVGSNNLNTTSLIRNNEAALYTTDEYALNSAKDYFNLLIESSEKIVNKEKPSLKEEMIGDIKGFCIECGKNIDYNKERPVCKDCFSKVPYYYKWRKFCHECGKEERVNIPKPLCETCLKKSKADS